MKNLDGIINECVKKTLIEMDLVPSDNQGNPNLSTRKHINNWKMLYNLMDNVKVVMDQTWRGKNGSISKKDVNDIINYINMSINNIVDK